MTEIIKRKIIKLLKHADYRPLKTQQLAKALDVAKADYPAFKAALEQLRQQRHLIVGTSDTISLPPLSGKFTGTFRKNPKGFGFVIPHDPKDADLFIPPGSTADAMTGDTVVAKVVKKGIRMGQMRYSGKIVEIVQRANSRFVGTLKREKKQWFVIPDGKAFSEPVLVSDVTAKQAQNNDKVVIEIIDFPSDTSSAFGVIIEVLGKSGRYESEINSVIHQFHLPCIFETECLEQAHRAAADFKAEPLENREDITNKTIMTIDPAEAKDFDDAISLEKNQGGNWVLGIHIADVSTFVTPQSPLDLEARKRGNSTYLPQKTIPMLPEVLSNGVCSLQPGQIRLAKSAYITYDKDAKILNRRFANSIIKSTQRLTYTQADRILKGHTKNFDPDVITLLKNAETLARTIEERRRKNGMIHLDLPETELVFDKAGQVIDAEPADDSYPHTIIEMFMVEANEAVASLLDRLDIPFIRRIHPEPNSLSLKKLSLLVRSLGVGLPKKPTRSDLQQLLETIKDTDASLAINLVVLRSFEKAVYSPLNIGHYALASTHYCHFTSPIRRYADLIVHRILNCYIQNRLNSAKETEILSSDELNTIAKHITFTDQQAEDAERELKTVLLLQMLEKQIGSELDCIVTGVTSFGVFAQCKKFGIEGLIQTQDLGEDKWYFNNKAQCITGENSGLTITLGKSIKARIISINIPARQMNLAPSEPLVSKKRKPPKTKIKNSKKSRQKRKKR